MHTHHEGDEVVHRTHRSIARVLRTPTHRTMNNVGQLVDLPVLEVCITERGPKTHHKDDDVVLWADADCIRG